MPAESSHDFSTTQLDTHLLSTPFKIKTNWHVITGAPCSGKSTLIDLLAGKGFQTNPESGRIYFEQELAKGRTIEEIRQDPAAMTRQIYAMMLEREDGLQADDVIFLDRALPDAFAFYRIAGMNPNEVLADCLQYQYASVFMLNRLPYQRDGVRLADDPTAEYYDFWTACDYQALGYKVIRVPVLPPQERLIFVLERLSELSKLHG